MKGTAAAALALGVVLPMALAHAFSGQDGNASGRQHAPALQARKRQTAKSVPLIYTAAPVYESLAALRGEERFPQGAQLMVWRAGRAEPLVPGFAASADASVSFDGKTVLFAGKRSAEDPWQIWQVPAEGGAPRRVYGGRRDAIRPLWMPEERIVFAERGANGFALMTTSREGGPVLRLSYLPGNFVPDDVLRDGRVLFESGFPLGAGMVPEMALVYADGSGVESVRCDHTNAEKSGGREHGREMASGDIVFVRGRRLARFTSALAEEDSIAAPEGELAGDVTELPDGRWLLSMRRPGQKHYGLVAWRPGTQKVAAIAQEVERDLVEPVVGVPRAVPHRHPSALHNWTTGNLLALDVRLSRDGDRKEAPASVRVETLNGAGQPQLLGTAPVEKDGSFFVKTPGDAPLRFILLDAAGRTVREEHGWFWMRGGEQRICVGCHTGPERAPDNRVPAVLLRTTIPVDVTGTDTKAAAGGH